MGIRVDCVAQADVSQQLGVLNTHSGVTGVGEFVHWGISEKGGNPH